MLWADSGRVVYFVPPPQRSSLDLCALCCLLSLAPANWLLWESRTATHSHTVDDIRANTHRQRTSQPSAGGLAHTGAPLLLLSQLSAQEMFEVPPAVLFDQLHCVVSCHCNFANLHWLISVWAANALTASCPLTSSSRSQSHSCSTVYFTKITFLPSPLFIRLRSFINVLYQESTVT